MVDARRRRRQITWSIPLAERGQFVGEGEHAEVAVAVVTYNSAHDMPTLINDLRRDARTMALRLVVVDNDSQDGSADLVAAEEDIVLIRSDRNLGFGAGVNEARTRIGPCSAVLILTRTCGYANTQSSECSRP